jgi:hypothetical protein
MEPKTQRAAPAPPPPTINTARISAEQNDTRRKAQGRASTFLSTEGGRMGGSTALKSLMGQGDGGKSY